jgi:RNA recognition motif-containing protein
MQGRSLTITFAEPRFMEQGAAPAAGEIKSVFVGKLPESATEEKLQALFSGFGEIEKVTRLPKFDQPASRLSQQQPGVAVWSSVPFGPKHESFMALRMRLPNWREHSTGVMHISHTGHVMNGRLKP